MYNFQSIVSQFFEWQTSVVVRWPLPFLLIPPLLTIGIVGLTITDFKLNTTNETLQVFLPDDMRSLTELKELMNLFPPRDAQRDSYSIFGSKFVYTVYEDPRGNALTPKNIKNMARLHKMIMTLKTPSGKTFSSLCLLHPTFEDGCAIHPLAYALEDEDPMLSIQFLLRYPVLKFGDIFVDNAIAFGGVKLKDKGHDQDGNGPIESAAAVRIVYVLDQSEFADSWINTFLSAISSYKENGTNIYWSSSSSLAKEMERNGALLIPWMPWTALVLVLFCMVICSSKDTVRSQPLIGFFAMFNASLATVASTALLLYLRYPFLPLVFIMPFLVVSIGTDNMFLMLKTWRLTEKSNLEDSFVEALTETAASLFLTSLTDGLSFSIGSISDFYAVRVFCTYCAMAILVMFLFQISLFNAVMVLCCRRELAGRHSLLCFRVNKKSSVHFNEDSFARRPLPSPPATPFGEILARIIDNWFIKSIIGILYTIYLAGSIYFTIALPLGLDLKLLAPDGSYVAKELAVQELLFNDYGSYCFAVVKTINVTIHEPGTRRKLIALYEEMTSSVYASRAEFWLEEYEKLHRGEFFGIDEFVSSLQSFLSQPEYKKFRNDIRFTMHGEIEATKMILRVRNLGAANDQPRANILRSAMQNSGFDGFVYDTSFLLVDQQFTTVCNVIINILTAVATMLCICILMVPRPVSSLCIAVSILSINVGVVGALSAASTRLDIISMITIVMSIGFSVDYVTHTTFHYVIQKEDRLAKCLVVMAEPILQSALSTVVGVALLAFVPSYIVRTFVYTVFFVVGIGVIHGLIFVPVLLSISVPDSEYLEAYSNSHQNSCMRSSDVTPSAYFIPVRNQLF